MKKIRDVEKKVRALLIKNPIYRDSDTLLYVAYCMEEKPEVRRMTFCEVMENLKELGLPTYESVGRSRRKIQEREPDLKGSKDVEEFRYENFKLAREYALT